MLMSLSLLCARIISWKTVAGLGQYHRDAWWALWCSNHRKIVRLFNSLYRITQSEHQSSVLLLLWEGGTKSHHCGAMMFSLLLASVICWTNIEVPGNSCEVRVKRLIMWLIQVRPDRVDSESGQCRGPRVSTGPVAIRGLWWGPRATVGAPASPLSRYIPLCQDQWTFCR